MGDASLVNVNFRIAGQGTPTLVFVHGYGCALDDWNAQVDGLSATYRCVAIDLPGHGRSERPERVAIAELAKAVNEVRRQVGADPAVLVGHSMGCKVVREAYRQNPAGVAGIVFVDANLFTGEREPLLRQTEAALERVGFETFLHGMFDDMFSEASPADTRQAIINRAVRMPRDFARSLMLETVGWDPLHGEETLRNIKVPTLLLQSTYQDSKFGRRPLAAGMTSPFMDIMTSLVADLEIQVVPDVGHFTMIEAPAVVNRHLSSFAGKLHPK